MDSATIKGLATRLCYWTRRGQRVALGEWLNLTPRAWLVGARVLVDDFTDAVNARVSIPDANRLMSGVGAMVETAHAWDNGAFSLRGSVDFERIVSGADTVTEASGERLSLEAARNGILLGLHGLLRMNTACLDNPLPGGATDPVGPADLKPWHKSDAHATGSRGTPSRIRVILPKPYLNLRAASRNSMICITCSLVGLHPSF